MSKEKKGYLEKWKDAIDSIKKPTEFNNEESALTPDHERLIHESMARLRELKKGLPDVELPDVELPTLEVQESEVNLTLREQYGFKEPNYDD